MNLPPRATAATVPGPDKSTSQTLDRGIRVLEVLAQSGGSLNVASLARVLGVDRAVTYRMLRTLAAHRLVVKDEDGYFRLGSGLLTLGHAVARDLQAVAGAELARLAKDLGATAFITIAEAQDTVCLMAVEPPVSHVHVVYRPGLRHALDRGGSGIALLAGRRHVSGERPEVTEARARGFAVSEGEIQPGTVAVAAPISVHGGDAVASVAVVSFVGVLDLAAAADRVMRAANAIAIALT